MGAVQVVEGCKHNLCKKTIGSGCLFGCMLVVIMGVTKSMKGTQAYTLEKRALMLPLKIFEAQPPQGKRIVQITVQVESDFELSFLIHGGTWGYRNAFEAAQIYGLKDENGIYYRVVKSVNVGSEDKDRLLSVLGDGVLKSVAARVTVEGRARADTPSRAFLESLGRRPHLFFA